MLRSERVTLRPEAREDRKRIHELMNREIELVMLGHGDWRPRPLARMEYWFDKHLDDNENLDFAIEADGKVIGDVALHNWTLNRREGTAEMGIGIYDPAYIGKGYGREALNLLLEWSFVTQNLRRIWLGTWACNERAIRAYRSCGFVEEGRQRQEAWFNGDYVDIVIMGLLRSEWEAHRAARARR